MTDYFQGEKIKAVAIIPARGGSKRIPRKNIKEFCGQPIIKYSINAALSSGIFDEVMVSTDDTEIADISRRLGANVPFMRSEKTANDYAIINEVLEEVILKYKESGREFDYFCCIYPTAPFIKPKQLNEAKRQLLDKNAGIIMSVVRFSYPPQRSRVINNGRLEVKWLQYQTIRSQDLEPMYHDCGMFFMGRVKDFLTMKFEDRYVIPLIIAETEVQDIDTEEDWQIAEMKYKILHAKTQQPEGTV